MRLETMGSPALGQGSNCRLKDMSVTVILAVESGVTYNVYFRCSSISIIAAWLPHL